MTRNIVTRKRHNFTGKQDIIQYIMNYLLSKPTTLYVMGNGFDRHHGILCSYINFRDWMKDNYRDVY